MSPSPNASAIRPAAVRSQAASATASLRVSERAVEVGDDVVSILTAYGEPEEPLGDPGGGQLVRGELPMARGSGMRDDGLDAAEARRARAELHRVHDALAGAAPTDDLEREDAAEAVELARRELVLSVILESEVVNPRHLSMPGEETRDGERVSALALDAHSEGLQAAAE